MERKKYRQSRDINIPRENVLRKRRVAKHFSGVPVETTELSRVCEVRAGGIRGRGRSHNPFEGRMAPETDEE